MVVEVDLDMTLLALEEEAEEEYDAYLAVSEPSNTSDHTDIESSTAFEAFVNGCDSQAVYTDECAGNGLETFLSGFSREINFMSCNEHARTKNCNTRPRTKSRSIFSISQYLPSLEFFERSTDQYFLGALLDTRAQCSVIVKSRHKCIVLWLVSNST